MTPPEPQKVDLLKWANDQNQLPPMAKAVLKELAYFADADGSAWAKVATLAYAVNVQERQVQRHLDLLRKEGLIRLSGRNHRLKRSTRSVPLYQLAPCLFEPELAGMGGVDDTHTDQSMGVVDDTHTDPMGVVSDTHTGEYGCHPGQSMGVIHDTPHRIPLGFQERADALSASERATEAEFEALERALPPAMLKFSDRGAAFDAYCGVAADGVGLAELLDCVRRMLADPVFKTRKFPPTTEAFLAKRMFRGWADGDEPAAASLRPEMPRFAGPPEIRAAFVAVAGDDKTGSYLDRAGWDGERRALLARTGVAADWLSRWREVLKKFDLVVEREVG